MPVISAVYFYPWPVHAPQTMTTEWQEPTDERSSMEQPSRRVVVPGRDGLRRPRHVGKGNTERRRDCLSHSRPAGYAFGAGSERGHGAYSREVHSWNCQCKRG